MIVNKYESLLISYVISFLKTLEAAQDIAQETFLRLWNEEHNNVMGREKPWILKTARNLAIDKLRRRSTRISKQIELKTHIEIESSPLENSLPLEHIISSLNENQKEVLTLKFRHGLSYSEISELTGYKPNHIGVLVHNAIASLRKNKEDLI